MYINKKNITIPQCYKSIIDKIEITATENCFDVYIVGGFVRDLLINKKPNDLDIMVCGGKTEHEKKIASIIFSKTFANKYKLKKPILFEKFGTAKLFFNNKEIEFVIPRKEYYNIGSRNPYIKLASLKQDALRRDFTINALFLRIKDMEIIDLTNNGIKDIKNKIIRVTDTKNAKTIFREDPLRILRALRQSVQLNFKIEQKTLYAIKTSAQWIKIVSIERVRDEINKILVANNPSKIFILMLKINLLNNILSDLNANVNINTFSHNINIIDNTKNDITLRMSILMFNILKLKNKELHIKTSLHKHNNENKNIKYIEYILRKLKYSNKFIKKIIFIVQTSKCIKAYSDNWTDGMIRKFAKKCDDKLDLIMEFSNLCYNKNRELNKLKKRIKNLKSKNILYNKQILTGNEIMNICNNKNGKWIQNIKKEIEEIQLENYNLTKRQAIKIVKNSTYNKKT
ncbi:MAG: CCA tRNA nucleotidyltransferase [Endomicrobium sp.]|jgi:tRNA nucleotidyltransferase/poly(A) polymerase|nr:CCA tRNA nucleotidyltransferase [Endomicrobium sp.]